MDTVTPSQRHKNMQAIRAKDTSPEITLRKALWHLGYRYRKNYRGLPGTPDIVFVRRKIAIFCDGEFWHGHNYSEDKIATNKKFWQQKIKRNRERDLEVTIALRDAGWTVLRFWENEIKNDLDGCVRTVVEALV